MRNLWTAPTTVSGTVFSGISGSMQKFSEKYRRILPDVKSARNLMCFSDYSGEEAQSNHFVYSFLIINGDQIGKWNLERLKLRSELLSDGRRISYKNYRDKLTEKFVTRYLKIVDELEGYIITVSVSKSLDSLFEQETPTSSNQWFSNYSNWPKTTREKTFQIMHFLALFISGFSKEHQNVLWVTDNDSIAPNAERLTLLSELFGVTVSQYLNHNLGHIRVATTNSDDGSRSIEDLCAVPDLVAGAYSDQLKSAGDLYHKKPHDVFWAYSPQYKQKTKDLTWWLAISNNKLCKLCFQISPGSESLHVLSFYHFYNRDYNHPNP